ncbi:zinc transporter ZIP1-like [Babylonia areolata]|uniref:zinc transporter ZIP1-like n=1 Tax=Babylonia areolata TaxID=304850 RepID=UPI003FD155F3
MLSLVASKGLILGVLFLMTFCLGLVPVKLMTFIQRNAVAPPADDEITGRRRRPRLATYKRILSFLSCFAAGVFLATCFLDLLPGVRKRLITVLFKMNVTSGFPLAEFIMSLGLFFILIVEQIVLLVKESRHDNSDVRRPLLGEANKRREVENGSDEDVHEEFLESDHTITGISDEPDIVSVENVRYPDNGAVSTNRQRSDSDLSHHHHHHHDDLQSHSPLRALMLVMALSLHSVFEGLAVGLQTSTGQVLGIFAALVLHKSILSFSIGMSLVQSRLSLRVCVRTILFFALTAPVGVAVGIIITYFGASTTSDLADGILTGMASGTFLYMTFFEVLPAEFNNAHDRLLKLLMLLLGFGTVTGILFLSDDVKAPFCKINGGT